AGVGRLRPDVQSAGNQLPQVAFFAIHSPHSSAPTAEEIPASSPSGERRRVRRQGNRPVGLGGDTPSSSASSGSSAETARQRLIVESEMVDGAVKKHAACCAAAAPLRLLLASAWDVDGRGGVAVDGIGKCPIDAPVLSAKV
ncbi:hypothetical protein THAOC_12017, partial [Thalassiosira oceanica]